MHHSTSADRRVLLGSEHVYDLAKRSARRTIKLRQRLAILQLHLGRAHHNTYRLIRQLLWPRQQSCRPRQTPGRRELLHVPGEHAVVVEGGQRVSKVVKSKGREANGAISMNITRQNEYELFHANSFN